MQRYVTFIVRHRFAVIVATGIVTALLATQLPHLRLEIRQRAQLPADHPYVRVQNRVADLFGGETTLIVGVIPHQGDIFTPAILATIMRLTRRIEEAPGVVRSNVLSIAAERVKTIEPAPDGMDVRPLMAAVPADPAGLRRLKARVLDHEIYKGILVAADGSAAAIVADFDDRYTDAEICTAIEAIIDGERSDLVEFALGGAPVLRATMARYTRQMAILFPLAVLAIALIHFEAFRTLQAMILPLTTALLSVVWALGIMAALRQPMDTWSAITPVVILAIAAGHAVQILKRYYEEFARSGDSEQAVIASVTAVGPVMLTAGLIAAAGFGSLLTFGVSSVRAFGAIMADGILSALIIEMTFTPACRAALPAPRRREAMREREGRVLSAVLDAIASLVVARPRAVIAGAVLLAAVSIAATSALRVDNSFRAWFPATAPLRQQDELLNAKLAGTSTLYVLLDGAAAGDLEEPAVLRAVSDLQAWLGRQPHVGATLSYVDFVKRMHRVMSGADGGADAVPSDRDLVAQYLLLYSLSGPDDFASLLDPAHREGVVRAYVKTDEAGFAGALFARLEEYARNRFRGLPVRPGIAGGALGVQTALNEEVVRDKIANVVQIGVLIFVLSSLALGSAAGGLLVLAPLAVALAVTLGAMGLSGTSLSIGTATITAMAVSIGADFAIYVLFRIREELARAGGDLPQALRASLSTSGKAIFFVSSAVVVGYLVLAFSPFKLWVHLGALTALMIAVSACAALTIIPAVVMLLRPDFLWRRVWPVTAAEKRARGRDASGGG